MHRRLGRHMRQNLVAYIALFFAMGGTAYAAATIGSGQVIDNSLQSGDLRDNAAVLSRDVVDDSVVGGGLVSGDVRDRSIQRRDLATNALDSCPDGMVRRTRLCVRTLTGDERWHLAVGRCANLGLRLPSYSEAVMLAQTDLPGLTSGDPFWTDSPHYVDSGGLYTFYVTERGGSLHQHTDGSVRPLCVTTPSS